MDILTIENSAEWVKFKITAPYCLSSEDFSLNQLGRVILIFHALAPIEKVIVTADTFPAVYKIFFVDGRIWIQQISERSLSPLISFAGINENTQWTSEEFLLQREVRIAMQRVLVNTNCTAVDIRPR